MKPSILVLLISILTLSPLASQTNDPELAEKLKSVMALFDKNQKALEEEIVSLTESNEALTRANLNLFKDLQSAEKRIKDLEAENLLLRSKISEVAVRELESASLTSQPGSYAARERTRADAAIRTENTPPRDNAITPTPRRANSREPDQPLININTASHEELTSLPLIDDAMAEQIISNRPYNTIEDLIINQGFGPMKLRRVTPFVTVGETQNPDKTQ
ncbi:MAG: helix-hairpin-helix domain-containing protein [Verrucomicrobiae bacterium]|nr:helix-hairpin-helix domain-containing protein [Verrucomicrobiae bacterium]